MQFIVARDSHGHQVQSYGLTDRQMLGQNSPLNFFPCVDCGAVLLAMLKDIKGVMVTGQELFQGFLSYIVHPDSHKLYKINDTPHQVGLK